MTVKWKTNKGKVVEKNTLSKEDKVELATTLQRLKFFLSKEKEHIMNAAVGTAAMMFIFIGAHISGSSFTANILNGEMPSFSEESIDIDLDDFEKTFGDEVKNAEKKEVNKKEEVKNKKSIKEIKKVEKKVEKKSETIKKEIKKEVKKIEVEKEIEVEKKVEKIEKKIEEVIKKEVSKVENEESLLLQFLENSEAVNQNKKLSDIFLSPKEEKIMIDEKIEKENSKKTVVNNNDKIFEENPYKASIYEPEKTFYASESNLHNSADNKNIYNFEKEVVEDKMNVKGFGDFSGTLNKNWTRNNYYVLLDSGRKIYLNTHRNLNSEIGNTIYVNYFGDLNSFEIQSLTFGNNYELAKTGPVFVSLVSVLISLALSFYFMYLRKRKY